MPQGDAETLFVNVLSFLNGIFPGIYDKEKLIAQCYDCVLVIRENFRYPSYYLMCCE